jgi:hypothetical protein
MTIIQHTVKKNLSVTASVARQSTFWIATSPFRLLAMTKNS